MDILVWQVRQREQLTLVQLEARTGISKSEINAPRLDTMERLAVGLGVAICDLYVSSITNSGK